MKKGVPQIHAEEFDIVQSSAFKLLLFQNKLKLEL